MDFDFQISFAEKHPAYTITPMTGTVILIVLVLSRLEENRFHTSPGLH